MEYIRTPNLPNKAVKFVITDSRINIEIEKSFSLRGISTIKVNPYIEIYNAIACHPDILFHHLGDEYLIYAPGVDSVLLEKLRTLGFKLIEGKKLLKGKYPDNIAYNACRVGKYVFHNMKYIDDILRLELEKRNIEMVNVKQGYSKCSISVVDENSIITADGGIAKAALGKGMDVLLIEPEKAIKLHELDYGFIGGCTGLLDKKRWAVAGNIDNLKSANRIKDFLKIRGIDIICLYDGPVVDIGTIIPIGY